MRTLTRKLKISTALLWLCFWGSSTLYANESVSLCDRSQAMLEALWREDFDFDCKKGQGNAIFDRKKLRLDFRGQEEPPACGDFAGFSGLNSLEIIDLDGEIPECLFSGLENLKNLTMTGGSVTTLPEKLFSKMKRLTSLTISGTLLAHLPDKIFSDLDDLVMLQLFGNRLESIDNLHLERLPNLQHLRIDKNQLTNVPVQAFRDGNLYSYQYLENPLTGEVAKVLGDPSPLVRGVNVCQLSAPVRVALARKFGKLCGFIRESDLASTMDLQVWFSAGDQMSCSDLNGLPNLRRLGINGYLGNWPSCLFKHNQNLLELEVNDSFIDSESFAKVDLRNLLRLSLSSVTVNGLTKEFFASMPRLRHLFLESVIDSISGLVIKDDLFEKLKALKYLELGSLELSELPENIFAHQFELISLAMLHNKIKVLNRSHLQNLKSLRGLSLAFNHLTTLPPDLLYDLANLNSITFEGNAISEIPEHFFSRQFHLREVTLSASVQKIHDDSFVNAKNIESVDVSRDSLTDTSKAAFKGVPQVIGLPERFGSDPDGEWEAR